MQSSGTSVAGRAGLNRHRTTAVRARLTKPAKLARARSTIGTTLTIMVVALSLAAAAIHLAAAPGHLEELGALGWGFVLAAVFQVAWPLAYAVTPIWPTAVIGATGNSLILGAWAWSRTFGLPVGPLAGRPEAIAVPDLAAAVFELVLVGLIVFRAAGLDHWIVRKVRRAPAAAAAASVPAVALIFVATAFAVAIAMSHEHSPGDVLGHPEEAGAHGHP